MNIQPNVLYDQDFNAWALDEAKKLKLRKFDVLDIDNLIEEIEDMSKREISSLESRLVVLIMHLIKWQVQTEKQCGSWRGTISSQRLKIKKLLKEMPSLKNHLSELISDAEVYKDALQKASEETGIHQRLFPQELPYSQDQMLDNEFYPDE
jgi:hypothetical protein